MIEYLQKKTANELCSAHGSVPLELVRADKATYPTFSMLSQSEATRALVQIIAGVYISFAKEATEEALLVMAVQLWNDLQNENEMYVRGITFEEINRAITWAKGRGELYANEASIFQAICSFYRNISMPTSARLSGKYR